MLFADPSSGVEVITSILLNVFIRNTVLFVIQLYVFQVYETFDPVAIGRELAFGP